MGRLVWNPSKSLWNAVFLLSAAALAPLTFTWPALALFGASTALSLCVGHSVGLHRLLIHQSFRVPRWLERVLVTLGVAIGMGGPLSLVRLHNTRDFFQNEPDCDLCFASEPNVLRDWLNSMHCRFEFAEPYEPRLDPDTAGDLYFQWLEARWRWL